MFRLTHLGLHFPGLYLEPHFWQSCLSPLANQISLAPSLSPYSKLNAKQQALLIPRSSATLPIP